MDVLFVTVLQIGVGLAANKKTGSQMLANTDKHSRQWSIHHNAPTF